MRWGRGGNENGGGDERTNARWERTRERTRDWRGKMERGWRVKGGGELWYPPHMEKSSVEDQEVPFRTWHHLSRQMGAPAGSQQLRVRDPARPTIWYRGEIRAPGTGGRKR